MGETKAAEAQGFESGKSAEHPVWKVLLKEKYDEDMYAVIEKRYDFIETLVNLCGNVAEGDETVPAMRVFFDMWKKHSDETFSMLHSLVYPTDGYDFGCGIEGSTFFEKWNDKFTMVNTKSAYNMFSGVNMFVKPQLICELKSRGYSIWYV